MGTETQRGAASGPEERDENLPQRYRSLDLPGCASFAGYLTISILFFGRALSAGLPSVILGKAVDTTIFIWSLVWWPHAVGAGLNPFITKAIWAPTGYNLAWATSIPLASFAAYPLTATFGPVASYNLLVLLCPALAAWSAFVLCRYISGNYWAAVLGGYVFGFSPYMIHHIAIGHLHLLFIFPIPLAVYAFALKLDDRIGDMTYSITLAAVLIAQFLLATETFATLVVFGAIGLVVVYAFAEQRLRDRIVRLAAPTAIALLATLVVLAPYFYYIFAPGFPDKPVNSPNAYSIDVLNLLVPTPSLLVGAARWVVRISNSFTQGREEPTGYFSLPLLVMFVWYCYRRWNSFAAKVLTIFVVVAIVFAIGPRIHFAGHVGPGMPWKLATRLPLLNSALPSRFMIYVFLAMAVTVSLVIGSRDVLPASKYAAAGAIVLFSLPNLSSDFWVRANESPEFFTTGLFKQYVAPGENVVVLPYGVTGNSMLWQAEADMYYRMAGGYVSVAPPDEFLAWPITSYFLHRDAIPDAADQLKAFLATHDVSTILVTDQVQPFWTPVLSALAANPQHVGGAYIYKISADELASYRAATAIEMEKRFDSARFDALVLAAQQYLAGGGAASEITPLEVQSRHLLPNGWVKDPDIRTRNGLYLGPADAGDGIAVGITGSYEALKPAIERYRSLAGGIYFPYPAKLSGAPRGNTFMRLLVMNFSPDALSKAADVAKQRAATATAK